MFVRTNTQALLDNYSIGKLLGEGLHFIIIIDFEGLIKNFINLYNNE